MPAGFRKAFLLAMRVRPGGCIWAAPQCSSWVWIGRASTGRSSTSSGGNVSYPKVKNASRMVAPAVNDFSQ
eukprot:6338532-Alexandrium_andersonii.AAC.1